MNLFGIIELARSRINRVVTPEAAQKARQAMLGLKNVVGGSLIQLLFRLILKEAIRDVLIKILESLSG
jgi:hypothetical protein